MNVVRFSQQDTPLWNAFLSESRNGTFLFNRAFLSYHGDRFTDYSLLVKDDAGKITALLPANITTDNIVVSHSGLTYGGFVFKKGMKLTTFLRVYSAVLQHLEQEGIKEFRLKVLPAFFDESCTAETEYALFLSNPRLYRRDVAFVIDQKDRIPYTGNIRREGNKAEKAGAEVRCDEPLDAFWTSVLEPNLRERFGVSPVHSLEEIQLLKSRFPENIKQYNVYLNDQLMGGTTMFLTPTVAHCQYISATDEGRANGCLNFLFKELLDKILIQYPYFDFGIVNEQEGRAVNQGMLFWKESFGGRARKHDFYSIDTASYKQFSHLIK